MAGKKETQRFVFYKYVPPKREIKPLKDEEYSKAADTDSQKFGPPDDGCLDNPILPVEECSDYSDYPEYPCEHEPQCPDENEEHHNDGQCGEAEEHHDDEYPCEDDGHHDDEYPCEDDGHHGDKEPCEEEPEGPCPAESVMHVIQAGDTFWKLAKKYGTTIEAIAAANPEADPLNLQVGETLCIPLGIPGAKG